MKRYAALILLLVAAGCGSPQLGAENYGLVESLRTAVSARRTDWLESNAKRIAARHQAGKLDDAQFATLQAIIKQCQAGDWEAADAAVVKLVKAQRREGS